jgi:hypothetical protein
MTSLGTVLHDSYFVSANSKFYVVSVFSLLSVEGHVVSELVEALCYKPEGCWFISRQSNWTFFIYLIHPAAI